MKHDNADNKYSFLTIMQINIQLNHTWMH